MVMRIEFNGHELGAKIKVVGVGGGGGNAVANMIAEQLDGVEFISVNTDAQALDFNPAPLKIQIGPNLTKGLGAGGNPDVGRKAALEDVNRLEEVLDGADMVFVAAGMGGGTGTGAAPIAAQVARDKGALTVGVVTQPFRFEGKKRRSLAEEGIAMLSESVDTLITIPNDKLLSLDTKTTMREACRIADQVLCNAVRGISDLITVRGDINVDFADVKAIMSNQGRALMGTGYGTGENRALQAAELAINSPLLENVAIDGATGILVNITGGPDLGMMEVNEAVAMIEDAAHEDANIIFGYVTLDEPCDSVKITVIATGFGSNASPSEMSRSGGGYRTTSRTSLYTSSRPSQSTSPGVRAGESPAQVQVPSGGRVTPVQIKCSADESHLDIPTFIRKNHIE